MGQLTGFHGHAGFRHIPVPGLPYPAWVFPKLVWMPVLFPAVLLFPAGIYKIIFIL